MPQWLSEALDKSNAFIPHGHCYLWIPGLLWLHVISDTLIGIAYVSISLILYLFVRKIRLPFSPVFIAFGLFIGLCGLTHFLAVWTVWNPDYWLDGLIKAATAAASVATAIGLWYVRPQIEEVIHAARLSEERRIQLETTNAELEALYNKIKEVDELKTQFFANVSHELRTPLALILGPAESMRNDDNLTSDQQRQLRVISRNGKTLLKQVNDLLDVAKLEEGAMHVRYVRLNLSSWFRRIASQFEVAAEQREVAYRISAPEQPLYAEVDSDMLERVFINLLSNAFKFTPQHGEVHAELESGGDEFTFSVTDTGPGISLEEHQVIFERFRQTDGGATRQHGGTGLGLAIAKDFVGMHGGEIKLQSAPGGGARFVVRLPLRAPESAKVAESTQALEPMTTIALENALQDLQPEALDEGQGELLPEQWDRPSILVVEDTPEMSQFIASTLNRDYNVVTASDGQEGLEKALALRPDLVVTDVMMPRMSGDQLVSELRRHDELRHTPILLLTAKADDALRVDLLETGAQDYLTKPFLPQELMARVGNLISMKLAGDALRGELTSASNDIEGLAKALAVKHSQLQAALDATEIAREQAERASQVKSQFLAMISHEMRTPLSTINMNAQLLGRQRQAELSPAASSQLERMVRATQQLSTVIEGLLEYTRVESSKISARVESVDVLALAKEVVDVGQLEVNSSDVSLNLATPSVELQQCVTDPRLLRVVLTNLVSNALKFTQKGQVTLHVNSARDGCEFEVTDTGIGIPAEDIHRIFLPFEQLEPVQRKSIPGVGLGLALTKEIVELLGGNIEVKSEPKVGSSFRVWLPNLSPNRPDSGGEYTHKL